MECLQILSKPLEAPVRWTLDAVSDAEKGFAMASTSECASPLYLAVSELKDRLWGGGRGEYTDPMKGSPMVDRRLTASMWLYRILPKALYITSTFGVQQSQVVARSTSRLARQPLSVRYLRLTL